MRHLFIVSYGRSGSTLLSYLLNAIEGYCIRGENGGIVAPLAQSDKLLRSAYEIGGLHANDGPESPWYGFSLVDPDAWRAAQVQTFIEQILAPPAGTRVTGFKEVRYTPEEMDDEAFAATLDFLMEGFEDARIVFNTRDATQVAASAWWKTDYEPARVREIVDACDRRFSEACLRLGAERAFHIDYGDYAGRPEGFLPLLEWLGEEVPWKQLRTISARRLTHLQEPSLPRRVKRWAASKLQR